VDLDWVVQETRRRHPEVEGYELSVAMFGDTTADLISATLIPTFQEMHPDLVVYEAMNVGAGVAAGALGIPAAAFSIGMATFAVGMIHTAAVGYHAGRWAEHDRRAPSDAPLLAAALLDPVPPSIAHDGGTTTVPRVPIRPVAFSEAIGQVPDWLMAPRTRPRVYLTLGTVAFGAVDVLSRAIAEIAALDVDLLVAVGPEGDPAALGALPDDVHVERFVAQADVLPLVDMVVHHGGTGTVLSTFAAGLPQLILPQGADQFHNARSLTEIAAGRALRNEEQLPGTITAAVAEMIGDSSERQVATLLRDEIAALPTPAEVVPELVALVGTLSIQGR
jgi:UDP:flavonoid glycosyltransferase YjiC (YdhE family)